MKKPIVVLSIITTFIIISNTACNVTAEKNKANNWKSLFNGKNLNGWIVKIHQHNVGDNYENTFRVKDGKIQVNYDNYQEFGKRYGHLFYHKAYSSYRLKFDYRFTDQWLEDAPSFTYRNSGVMFHSQDPNTILKDQDWPISVEYQLLAEEKEGESRPTANVCTPGTDVFYKDELDPRHCIRSASKTYKWDDWVHGELIVHKDSLVVHLVNGDTVLRYGKPQIGGGVVNGFDAAVKIDGQALKEGFIGLQSEGQGIEFKEIKMQVLDL